MLIKISNRDQHGHEGAEGAKRAFTRQAQGQPRQFHADTRLLARCFALGAGAWDARVKVPSASVSKPLTHGPCSPAPRPAPRRSRLPCQCWVSSAMLRPEYSPPGGRAGFDGDGWARALISSPESARRGRARAAQFQFGVTASFHPLARGDQAGNHAGADQYSDDGQRCPHRNVVPR